MTNEELISKIKAEIKRRIRELDEQIVDIYDSKAVLRKDELQRLLSFISILESEKPMNQDGLKKEIESCLWKLSDDPSNEELCMFARHFAQWGAEHLRE